MHGNLPISEQFERKAHEWVDADAAAEILEQTKSAVFAEMLLAHGPIAHNRAEALSKASPAWAEHVATIVEARRKANRLKVDMEVMRMRHREWIAQDANQRTAARF